MTLLYREEKLKCPHCQEEIPVRTMHLDYIPTHSGHDKTVLTELEYQELKNKGIIKLI